jgi:hypothetical protein
MVTRQKKRVPPKGRGSAKKFIKEEKEAEDDRCRFSAIA